MNIKTGKILSPVLLFLLAVLPLVLGLGYALLYSFGITGTLNNGYTVSNWKSLFANNEVLVSFAYSGALSLISIALSVIIAFCLAVKYHTYFTRGLLSYFIYLPLAFPSVVAAFFFFELLSGAGGLSRLFYAAGMIHNPGQFPGLINDRQGIGIILTQTFLSCPVFILLYTSLIGSERLETYYILAGSLGATKKQFLRRITIPLLFKKSLPVILLYFIFKLGAYEIPLLLGRSSPQMVSVLTISKLQRFNLQDIPQGYAIAVIYAIFVFILLTMGLKNIRNGAV